MATIQLHAIGLPLAAQCSCSEVTGRPPLLQQMVVDTERGQSMRIHLNVSTPALPCGLVSLDVVDISGEHGDDRCTPCLPFRQPAARTGAL